MKAKLRVIHNGKSRPIKAWPKKALHIGKLLPNIVTLGALCMGLTSIHFAFLKEWKMAVSSILYAAVLDGIDGRLARLLGNSTDFGAELDSLVDFINFGVAPALLVYFFSLHHLQGWGWAATLFFTACTGLRLARFNIQRLNKEPSPTISPMFSVGVPAPAGGFMALLPVIFSFTFDKTLSVWFFQAALCLSAIMMVSRYPTFVFKKLAVPVPFIPAFLLCVLLLISGLLTMPWETLFLIGVLYLLSLPLSGYFFYKD